jgi:ABC-type sulfate/molybdate transport systems ATPase subunit
MMVRLAFSTMLEAEVDILLIDEVLAVGDASFMQKCNDAFVDMREAGKTVILVTHDMDSVERLCDRAMLLENGRVKEIGAHGDVGREYMMLNFAEAANEHDEMMPQSERAARMTGAWLEDGEGTRIYNVAEGEMIRAVIEVEIRETIEGPLFAGVFANSDMYHVADFQQVPVVDGSEVEVLHPGQRLTFSTEFHNLFRQDRYNASFRLCRNRNYDDIAMVMVGAIDFVVYGTSHGPGVINVEMDHRTELGTGE